VITQEGDVPYSRLFYHVVWATKNRNPTIGPDEERIIRRSFELSFTDLDVIPHAVGVLPDHIHVVASAPPKVSPAELVKRLKGASSRALNQEGARRNQETFAWQGEYGVLCFSEKALPTVIEYVANQPAHHAAHTLWPGLERVADETRRQHQPRPTSAPIHQQSVSTDFRE
jgi:putative transposase